VLFPPLVKHEEEMIVCANTGSHAKKRDPQLQLLSGTGQAKTHALA
jgi:hypothetical protein